MRHPISMEESNPHGSVVYVKGGAILQAIGIPTPKGFIAAIPKYVPCTDARAPWRRPSGHYCRVIREYGPHGVKDALARYMDVWRDVGYMLYDGVYEALMPYINLDDVIELVEPRRILLEVVSSGTGFVAEVASEILKGSNVSLVDAGLTGSYAAGIASPAVSDVDFIIYGCKAALKMYEYYKSALRPVEGPRSSFGGVKVEPPRETGWRRAALDSIPTSWVGVPLETASHCPPLRRYPNIDPPTGRVVRVSLRIDGGDPSALLYPPCVMAGDYYLVSFEYNVADMLFQGGRIAVEAVESLSGGTLYIGLRENPGRLTMISKEG